MAEQEVSMDMYDGLSGRARERLAGLGSLSDEDRRNAAEDAEISGLLRRFFKDELNNDDLFDALKEYERNARWRAIGIIREKLQASFKWQGLGILFDQQPDGSFAIARGEEEESEEANMSDGAVVEVTDATFDKMVEDEAVLVVDCWAPWCGPCRMVAPVIEELAKDFAGKVTFAKLNVDQNQAISMRYRIQSIPTMLFFKNGKMVDQKLGAMPKAMLQPIVEKHLGAAA
jgi:thioredoxin 1